MITLLPKLRMLSEMDLEQLRTPLKIKLLFQELVLSKYQPTLILLAT